MLGLFSLFFIVINEAYEYVFAFGQTNITETQSVTTLNIINAAWVWFPVAVLFSFVVYNIVKANKDQSVIR